MKLIKRLENDTDFDVCVFNSEESGFVVTVWDNVARKHRLDSKHSLLKEALSKAENLNEEYKVE